MKLEWMQYVQDPDAETIVIDDRVQTLECFAFRDCKKLKKVIVGKNVAKIEDGAFANCGTLQTVALDPQNQNFVIADDCLIEKKNGRMIFGFGRPLIPDCVQRVNLSDFRFRTHCEVLYIGESLKEFKRCYRSFDFDRIELSPRNTVFELKGGCLFYRGGTELILGANHAEIPEDTTKICREAFACSRINSVTIPKNVREIMRGAFSRCDSLIRLNFEEGVQSIGNEAFYDCSALSELTLPQSLSKTGEEVFGACTGLKTVHSFGGLTELSDSLFCHCKGLTELVIPGSVKTVARCAFYGCETLQSVTFETGVKTIGESSFHGCFALKKAIMADTLTLAERGDQFLGCGALTEVRLSHAIKTIPLRAFCGCSKLKEIELPASVTKIEDLAFSDCVALEKINVENVIKIARDAFSGCKKLPKEITKPPKKPAAKKLLPDELFSYYDYDTIAENFNEGSELTFLKVTFSEVEVVLAGVLEYEGNEYLFVTRKDEPYFIEVDDEPDEELTEYYPCTVYNANSKFYAELKAAYDQNEAKNRG